MRIWSMVLAGLAGLFGAAGVALAAIGAHRSGNPSVTTAADFLLFHAAALVGFSALTAQASSKGLLVAASIIALGVILFSGELAIHALTGVAALPMAAPTGGTAMIVGWLLASVMLPLALRDRHTVLRP
jgi:uncharacterized membrane protein YgdD (TMEM256/DUF423 family)